MTQQDKTQPMHKYIMCPPYKRGVSVFIGNPVAMQEWARLEFTNPEYTDFLEELKSCRYGAADTHFGNGSIIVRIHEFPTMPTEVAELVHELLHATCFLMEHSGVPFIEDNPNEAYAYMIEWLTKKALEEDGYEKVPAVTSGTLEENQGMVTSSLQ